MECIWDVLLGFGRIWGSAAGTQTQSRTVSSHLLSSTESSSTATTTVAVALDLPDDLLADVLGRLPARSLAASRCVCRSWRGVVDDRRLLLPLVLPHSVDALLLSCIYLERSHVFVRPTPPNTSRRPRIDSEVFTCFSRIYDQCNGLVLFDYNRMLYLCNPTTRHGLWVPYGRCDHDNYRRRRAFVAFDPAVSPHWQVLQAPLELEETYDRKEMARLQAVEWPPARWTWSFCSSRTMVWQRRVFLRQGEAVGTVAELVLLQRHYDEWGWDRQPLWSYSSYWKGVLYLHCRGEYVCRLSLLTNKHQVFKSPIPHSTMRRRNGVPSRMGTSKHGVYFAAIDDMAELRVWILKEGASSSGGTTMEWLLNHHSRVLVDNIRDHIQKRYNKGKGPWIMTTSRDDETDERQDNRTASVSLLGFHPYEEIIFLEFGSSTVAYHFNTPQVQYLGKLHPREYRGLHESFVYTPCLTRVSGMRSYKDKNNNLDLCQ